MHKFRLLLWLFHNQVAGNIIKAATYSIAADTWPKNAIAIFRSRLPLTRDQETFTTLCNLESWISFLSSTLLTTVMTILYIPSSWSLVLEACSCRRCSATAKDYSARVTRICLDTVARSTISFLGLRIPLSRWGEVSCK